MPSRYIGRNYRRRNALTERPYTCVGVNPTDSLGHKVDIFAGRSYRVARVRGPEWYACMGWGPARHYRWLRRLARCRR